MKLLEKTTKVCLAIIVSFSLSNNFTACSQTTEKKAEHPEHPKGAEHPEHPKGTEHPEHPEKAAAHKLTVEELSYAVKKYVDEESAKNDGYFIVEDNTGKLRLKLKKIHDDRLTSLSNTLHFVCADFSAPGAGSADGTVYDIDIFMEGTDKDNLKATEVKVHKKNGKPRYTWIEENGVWKTKDASAVVSPQKEDPKKSEHPTEHPNK